MRWQSTPAERPAHRDALGSVQSNQHLAPSTPVFSNKLSPRRLMDRALDLALKEPFGHHNLALLVVLARAQNVALKVAQLRSLMIDKVQFTADRSASQRPNSGVADRTDANNDGLSNVGAIDTCIVSTGLRRHVERRKRRWSD